jgi:hypothetical protein
MSPKKQRQDEDAVIAKYLSKRAQDFKQASIVRSNKNSAISMTRQTLFLDAIQDIFSNLSWPTAKPYKAKKDKKTERILNVILSDLHYGADLKIAETNHRYGPIEEARRTAAVVAQVADYKRQYRDSTVCYVHILGDIIQGKLHDPQDAAPEAEQFARAIWNLGQAIEFLSREFKGVRVFCTPGNHGRNKSRHPTRAVNQKWDSDETKIYLALQMVLKNLPNVTVETFLTPYYIYKAFGNRGFMTHGDTVLKPGFPGSSIAVNSVRHQINEINNGLGVGQDCKLFGVGHVHTASSTRLPNNTVFLTNGCLLPTDEYAQSIGIFDTTCCQQIFESTQDFIFGDRRDAIVDSNTDADKSLVSIIKPFISMEHLAKNGFKR